MTSKGQGLSLNTIVIAAIVLIVLLIIVGMITGYFGPWKKTFGKVTDVSCAGQGGKPATGCDEASGEKEIIAEVSQGEVCCKKVRETCGDKGGRCFAASPSCPVPIREGDWSCPSDTPKCCK